jgi:hypothetical protein
VPVEDVDRLGDRPLAEGRDEPVRVSPPDPDVRERPLNGRYDPFEFDTGSRRDFDPLAQWEPVRRERVLRDDGHGMW